MKVTVDAVLFGAWVGSTAARNILDLGCGTGLLSLMAAQTHPEAQVTGIELDLAAAAQAAENAAASKFHERIQIHHADAVSYRADKPADLIISNPPFFASGSLSPDDRRRSARSEGTLTVNDLVAAILRNLSEEGRVALLWQANRFEILEEACRSTGLYLIRSTAVKSKEGLEPHVVFTQWERQERERSENQIVMRDADGVTSAWKSLVHPFYPDVGRLR